MVNSNMPFSFFGRIWRKSRLILTIAAGLYLCCAALLFFIDPLFHTHQFGRWVQEKDPSCFEQGESVRRCRCGATEVQAVPKLSKHSWNDWFITLAPTDEADGLRTRSCSVCDLAESAPIRKTLDRERHGSAGWIGDTTVVVSIFADDILYGWSPKVAEDQREKFLLLKQVATAMDQITLQCAKYDCHPNIIYDWTQHPDLVYSASLTRLNMFAPNSKRNYETQREFVETYIPTEALKERYQAQNVLYLFFFDTSENNTSSTFGYYRSNGYDTEIINLYNLHQGNSPGDAPYRLPPSLIAMMTLRCFGAQPLWFAGDKITDAYITYLQASSDDDVMRAYYVSDTRIGPIRDLDAYYLGLLDHHPHVETYGLGASDFLP